MKFSTSIAPLALAAGAMADYIGAGYDALQGQAPGLLSEGGAPMRKQFRRLEYYPGDWSVLSLDGELLETLKPASAPNVLTTKAATLNTRIGRINKIDADAYFQPEQISFACVNDDLGQLVPVSCSVLMSSLKDSGFENFETYNYTGTPDMKVAILGKANGYRKARNLDFTVTKHGAELGDVYLLIDSLYYNTTLKGTDE